MCKKKYTQKVKKRIKPVSKPYSNQSVYCFSIIILEENSKIFIINDFLSRFFKFNHSHVCEHIYVCVCVGVHIESGYELVSFFLFIF